MIYNRIAQKRALADNVMETRTIEFVASDNTRDSHGTVLPVDKWKLDRYNANGVILYQHNGWSSDPDDVIGRGVARVEGDQLLVAITFEGAEINPKADKIFRKLVAGTLNGVSVSFIPTTTEVGKWGEGEEARTGKTPTFYFDGMELVEISVVTIPSNPNAVRRGWAADVVEHLYEALDGRCDRERIAQMSVREVVEMMEERGEEAAEELDTDVERARINL